MPLSISEGINIHPFVSEPLSLTSTNKSKCAGMSLHNQRGFRVKQYNYSQNIMIKVKHIVNIAPTASSIAKHLHII